MDRHLTKQQRYALEHPQTSAAEALGEEFFHRVRDQGFSLLIAVTVNA